MDGGSATSGHDSPSGLSLVMGRGSSASLSPLDHTAPTCSSGPHPRLGPQGRGRSSSASALLSLPFVRSPSPRQQTPPRLIIDLSRLNQYVFAPPFTLDNHMVLARLRCSSPRSTSPRRIPISRCGPIFTVTSPSRTWANFTFFTPFPSASMSPRIFLQQVLAWPPPLPAGQGDFPSRLLRRHCRLAPGSRHVTGPGTAGYGLSAGYGFPTQPRKITTVSFSVGGLAGRPLVASDGPLASSCRGSRGDPSHSSGPLASPSGHQQTAGAVGGSHQLRVPSPQVPASLPSAAHEGRHDRPSSRMRHAGAAPPLPCSRP